MKLKKDAIKPQSLKENANLRTTGQHQLRSEDEELKSTSDMRIKTEKT